MQINAKEFRCPKRGSSLAEYEDASSLGTEKGRFAVADGATEASFSGIWAKQLVRAFTNKDLSVPLGLEELKPIQDKWQKIVHRHPLPWYAEEKANDGAFAAFVGLEFLEEYSETKTEKTWRATAAGDSCLIQVRGNEILKAFPLSESASFNNSPNLLCSLPLLNGNENELVINALGSWRCDDVFFLMTDALACWFFREHEQGNKPWNLLRDLETHDGISFEKLVSESRANGRMKNDDVTLVRIDIFT